MGATRAWRAWRDIDLFYLALFKFCAWRSYVIWHNGRDFIRWALQSCVSLGPLPTALLAIPVGIAASIFLLLATDKVVYRFHGL